MILKNRSKTPVKGKKKNKYQELDEENDRHSNISPNRADGTDPDMDTYSKPAAKRNVNHYARRSRFEDMEGPSKKIKSQHTQQMTEIDTENENQRKKVFDTINERIMNSRVTVETDNDNSDLNNIDFLNKIANTGNKPIAAKPNKGRHAKHKSIIGMEIDLGDQLDGEEGTIHSSLFYGKEVPKHTKKFSILDGNDPEN